MPAGAPVACRPAARLSGRRPEHPRHCQPQASCDCAAALWLHPLLHDPCTEWLPSVTGCSPLEPNPAGTSEGLPSTCPPPCPPLFAYLRSWIATAGHSPGHISVLHRPSGTLIAGDALFNIFPSASFASGIEGLVTRPLGFLGGRAARLAFGPAQALLSSVLGSHWPAAVPAALNATLGSLSTERLTSGAVSRSVQQLGQRIALQDAPQHDPGARLATCRH